MNCEQIYWNILDFLTEYTMKTLDEHTLDNIHYLIKNIDKTKYCDKKFKNFSPIRDGFTRFITSFTYNRFLTNTSTELDNLNAHYGIVTYHRRMIKECLITQPFKTKLYYHTIYRFKNFIRPPVNQPKFD